MLGGYESVMMQASRVEELLSNLSSSAQYQS